MSAMPSSGLVGVSTQTTRVRAGLDRGAHGVVVADGGDGVLDAPVPEDRVEEAVGAAVGVRGHDDVVAGASSARRTVSSAASPEANANAALATLERGEPGLERGARRVGAAAVLVAVPEPADPVLLVGRGLVDRGDDGARRRVRVLPGVEGAGGEAEGLVSHATTGYAGRSGASPRRVVRRAAAATRAAIAVVR